MFTFVYIIFFTSNNHTYECNLLFNNRQGSCSFWFRSKEGILQSISGSSSIMIWSLINTSKNMYYMVLSFLVQISQKSSSHFSSLVYTIYLQSRRREFPFGMPHVSSFLFLTHSSHLSLPMVL